MARSEDPQLAYKGPTPNHHSRESKVIVVYSPQLREELWEKLQELEDEKAIQRARDEAEWEQQMEDDREVVF